MRSARRAANLQLHLHLYPTCCAIPVGFMADRREGVRVMQDWLGRASVQNSVRYTALAPERLDKAKAPG